jgi:signal transduction histidine kinase/CHASE3 domain sensor protein
MRLTTVEKINAGFAIALAVVAVIGLVSFRAMTRSVSNAVAVGQTHEVIASLERVLSAMNNAESAERGYIMTGDSSFLTHFYSADTLTTNDLLALRLLRLADAEQTQRLAQLGTLTARRLAHMRDAIAVRDVQGFDAAAALVAMGRGRAVMDTLRSLVGSMGRRERVLLVNAAEESAASARRAQLIVIAGTVFAFLLLLMSSMLLRRYIRQRVEAEHALRENETVLAQFMESLPVGAYVIDAAGQPRFANTAARALLGPHIFPDTAPEGLNETYRIYRAGTDELYPPSEIPLVQALAGFRVSVDDAEIHTPTGVVPLAVSAAPIYDRGGHVAYAIAVFDDITARRRGEEALRAAKESAEEASRTKSEFLARMSHELRTPLNSVIGFANILLKNKSGNLRAQDITYLERVLENGKHLLTLINDVLDLSKIEAGKIEIEKSWFPLEALVEEVVHQWDGQLRHGVRLDIRTPRTLAPIESDRARLKQVLLNLVSNAVKFTERGAVTVEVFAIGTRARRLSVHDTGIGIARDRLDAIFDAFEQAEATTARRFGGTGLGLPISRRLCELLGYALSVTSELNRGTTFTIDFAPPRRVAPAERAAGGAAAFAGGPQHDA